MYLCTVYKLVNIYWKVYLFKMYSSHLQKKKNIIESCIRRCIKIICNRMSAAVNKQIAYPKYTHGYAFRSST